MKPPAGIKHVRMLKVKEAERSYRRDLESEWSELIEEESSIVHTLGEAITSRQPTSHTLSWFVLKRTIYQC
jgi:hypothetical protein